jgi:hypothetical protein
MGPQPGNGLWGVQRFLSETEFGSGFDRLCLGVREIAHKHNWWVTQLSVPFDSTNEIDPRATVGLENTVHQHQVKGLCPQQSQSLICIGRCLNFHIEMIPDCLAQVPMIVRTVANCQDALRHSLIPPVTAFVESTGKAPLIGFVGIIGRLRATSSRPGNKLPQVSIRTYDWIRYTNPAGESCTSWGIWERDECRKKSAS